MLASKDSLRNDWLIFEVASNPTRFEPLQLRTTPLTPGEKVYVVGWTRHQPDGPQRVYEWQYVKVVDMRLLLKPVTVPATLGGLSGAPVLDSQGRVVGLVSNDTIDPANGKKYFSPCSLENLPSFLDKE